MITLRYHIVAFAAMFLALAVGVVLGSTAISDRLLASMGTGSSAELPDRIAELEAEQAELTARAGQADTFAAEVAAGAVAGRLTGLSVTMVSTSAAESEDRDATRDLIVEAGGTVAGELALTDGFTDPARADQLRDLVRGVLPAGVQLPTAADPGTMAGGLLGALLLIDEETGQPQASPEEGAAALGGLIDGGFVQAGADASPAELVVVLDGGADDVGDRASVVARFAAQLDRAGAGAVLTGHRDAAARTGSIGHVRGDASAASILSTVDSLDRAEARIAVVLALGEQHAGGAGHYGFADGAAGLLPADPGLRTVVVDTPDESGGTPEETAAEDVDQTSLGGG
ncbi:copper transporter [Actinoalloteichus hymeniacidonis]|uniref:DUF3186 family protein n=1 Tax=Actinoalloteichus hymeniacidonis TaxID=340345 RepID=A0AAC9HS72_9PSEU|nr:copper transporter [Actinoalloteichus hymeniacidonis]AOS64405.1 putative DUF3186 family protein [Actinoalloteichus hymeniacidonis]MBB5907527.1 hypothetical protein [Actinoalloteichus hymeniacidonis]